MNLRIVHRKHHVLSIAHPMEDFALRTFSIGMALALCLYIYLVTATALNVIAGKEANSRAAAIEGEVGMLQQRYFSLSRTVASTPSDAIGLVPVVGTAYVYRPSSVGMAYTADNAN